MEQEPVYVPSNRLSQVCESVLAHIYDRRETARVEYIAARCHDYNTKVAKANKYRRYFGWLGIKPKMFVTPVGMELMVQEELVALSARNPEAVMQHPMIGIHQQYGDLEHETKDAIIQCQMNETVPVSAGMARGISHLGLPLDFLAKPKFGFYVR